MCIAICYQSTQCKVFRANYAHIIRIPAQDYYRLYDCSISVYLFDDLKSYGIAYLQDSTIMLTKLSIITSALDLITLNFPIDRLYWNMI